MKEIERDWDWKKLKEVERKKRKGKRREGGRKEVVEYELSETYDSVYNIKRILWQLSQIIVYILRSNMKYWCEKQHVKYASPRSGKICQDLSRSGKICQDLSRSGKCLKF